MLAAAVDVDPVETGHSLAYSSPAEHPEWEYSPVAAYSPQHLWIAIVGLEVLHEVLAVAPAVAVAAAAVRTGYFFAYSQPAYSFGRVYSEVVAC